MNSSYPEVDLFTWQAPEQLILNAELVRSQLGSMSMHRAGKDFREAYVAARFARHREARSVRLLPPRNSAPTPDFAVRIGVAELWFETTEADRPERKRGDGDLSPRGGPECIPEHHWVEPADYKDLVRQRVQSKASKAYGKCDGLVVWSNAFPIADADLLTVDWWRDACLPAKVAFAEIWVGRSHELAYVFQRAF